MQLKKLAGLFFISIVLLTACSKKGPTYTQYIPKDASYVIALDVKGMIAKLEKDNLTVENMMAVLKDTTDPSKYATAMAIWAQFKDAGLDFDNKVMLAIPSIDMNKGDIQVQVLAGLKDSKKLEDFITKMPEAPKVQKEKDFSYAIHDDMIVGWNTDAVMILAGHKTPKINFGEAGEGSEPAAPIVPGGTSQLDNLKKYFGLKKAESIASLDEFNDLVGKTADIAIFTNTAGLAGSQANPAMAMMPKVKELMEGIYSASTINFEDGKMVMEGDTYAGKKLAEILKKYTGPVVDMTLVDPYPSNNVGGVTAFSFNPEMITAFLKETGFDALVDLGLAQKGLTTADIVKAFKGDFAIIFSDFTISKVEKTNWEGQKYMSTEPSAKLLVAVRIGDKAIFDKLVNLAVKEGMFIKNGNRLILANDGEPETTTKAFIGIENDLLVFSTDEEVYKGYVAKSSKIGLSDEARSVLKGASVGMFVDAGKIINAIPESILDSNAVHEKNILAKAKPLFKSISFNTENFDGKKIHGKGEVVMESGKNSLPQLVRFLMYAAEEMQLKEKEEKAKGEVNDDSNNGEPAN